MVAKIDKLRPPTEGLMSFVGTGVATIPDRLEDREDIRAIIHEEVEDIRVEIEVGPVQYSYLFASIKKIDQYIYELWQVINNLEAAGVSYAPVLCRAYLSGEQELADSNEYLIELDTESYDPQSVFDTANNRIVIPSDGYYLVVFQIYFSTTVAESRHKGIIGIGGAGSNLVSTISYSETGITYHYVNYADVQYLNEEDIIDLRISGPVAGSTLGSGPTGTWMAMAKVGGPAE